MEVRFLVGDITQLEVDAIVNPANSEGEMGGGVAAAIKKSGGKKIEKEAMALAPIPLGHAVVTSAGKLKCEYVIHTPTMMVPVQRTSAEKILSAVTAALQVSNELGISKLAIPGMGSGTGRVPMQEATKAIADTIRRFSTLSHTISEIIFVDKNKEWVQAMENDWNYTTPAIENE